MPIKPLVGSGASLPPVGAKGEVRKKIDQQKLQQACGEFEALFINQLLQSMRRTVIPSKVTGAAPGKDLYQSLFDREISQKMARQGGLGIGKILVQRVLEKEKGKPDQTGNNPRMAEARGPAEVRSRR